MAPILRSCTSSCTPARIPWSSEWGLAAQRDVISFFRYEAADAFGTRVPSREVPRTCSPKAPRRPANELKTFVHLGFNEDESGRTVMEGMNDYIARGRRRPTSASPSLAGAGNADGAGQRNPWLWWEDYTDVQRGRPTAGMLDRCRATKHVPKIIETFGATEFWDLRMSPA